MTSSGEYSRAMSQIDNPDLPDDFDPRLDLDLDQQIAQEAEATKRRMKIRIGGRWIAFPQMSEWPYETTERLNDGDMLGALDAIFEPKPGASEAERAESEAIIDHLQMLNDQKNSIIEKLFAHIFKVSGVGPGESNRSGRRSASRRRR